MLAVAGVVLGAFYMYVNRPLQGYHDPHIHLWQLQMGHPSLHTPPIDQIFFICIESFQKIQGWQILDLPYLSKNISS